MLQLIFSQYERVGAYRHWSIVYPLQSGSVEYFFPVWAFNGAPRRPAGSVVYCGHVTVTAAMVAALAVAAAAMMAAAAALRYLGGSTGSRERQNVGRYRVGAAHHADRHPVNSQPSVSLCLRQDRKTRRGPAQYDTARLGSARQCGRICFQLWGRMYEKSHALWLYDIGKNKTLIFE